MTVARGLRSGSLSNMERINSSPSLLGRHVSRGAHYEAGDRRRRDGLESCDILAEQARKPEVKNLYIAIPPHHDIRRLDVAVNDAAGMCHSQGFGNLPGNRDQCGYREFLGGEDVQSLSFNKLHGDIIRSARIPVDLVNRDDIRVVERGSRLCLLGKAANPIVVIRARGAEDLERDKTVETRIAGL
jgi:hypothetical protein